MTGVVRSYALYGTRLATSVEFPELLAVPEAPARWTFERAERLAPMVDARELGSDPLYGDVSARLYVHAGGHRIVVDDTGSFELGADGRRITWEPGGNAWPDFVRAHLMGRVLATSLYLDGLLPLHASAVETRDGVIAFLAPKGFGKSTLALALVTAGARLGTDDTLPIDPRDPPLAWPGIHNVRVHEDSITAVGTAASDLETREGKQVVTGLVPESLQSRPAPLAAIYLLDPAAANAEGVTRTPMPPTIAALAVVAHVKIGRMLGSTAAAPMLERTAAITGRVPVFHLHAPRDLERLGDTAAAILTWHGKPPR